MMVAALVIVPLAAALLAWLAARGGSEAAPRWVALAALVADLVLLIVLLARPGLGAGGAFAEIDGPWMPELGIRFHLVLDGLAATLALLTCVLGIVAVLASWSEIRDRVGLFHLQLLSVLAGVMGVFLAADLILFYFFWELMLVPMYFLIAIWGHERRRYASIKFFLFTQAGGLLMLLAIVALAVFHQRATGIWSFDPGLMLAPYPPPALSTFCFLGFVAAFTVKLPMVPFHVWLADAHTEAPTAGSIVLAGLLLKTGGYGLLRFAVPLFPAAAARFAPLLVALGAVGVVYGAIVALAQTDLKRLVAYTSVSHLGFVLIGAFAGSELAAEGAVVQMICHGLSTGALFFLVGAIQERLGTRELEALGGLWGPAPRFGTFFLLFALATLGLPGLGNFVGEILVLFGAYAAEPAWTIVATLGLVLSTLYALAMVQGTIHGATGPTAFRDLRIRETLALGVLAALLVGIGFYPQPLLDGARSRRQSPTVTMARDGAGVPRAGASR